jgi:hypothetical protein
VVSKLRDLEKILVLLWTQKELNAFSSGLNSILCRMEYILKMRENEFFIFVDIENAMKIEVFIDLFLELVKIDNKDVFADSILTPLFKEKPIRF